MSDDYDAIIVGARVAGAITTALLAQHNHRVLLLDRAHFPSDTLSTHFFRAPALRAFERIGVLDEVLATAPRLITDYNVVDGIVFPEPVEEPEDYPFYICVRRLTLDELLFRNVKDQPSVEIHEGAKVDGMLKDAEHVLGVTWSEAGQRREARGRVVVGADGIQSFLARELRPAFEDQEPVNRAMYYAYYRGFHPMAGPAAEFHYRGNHLVYVFPCDGALTLLAASVPISEFADFRRDPEGRLLAELEAMSEVAPRLSNAAREGPVRGTGSIPGYMRVPYGMGWALVGDSGMLMDPWSGQGIDQASTHAAYLADRLHDYLSGRAGWGPAMSQYHLQRNAFSRKTYDRTCTFGRDLRPMTRKALERRRLT